MNLSPTLATFSALPLACAFFNWTLGCQSLKILSDHDSTLFQANGITLKPDKKFHHAFNVQHIARTEAKQLKVSGELENLEKKKETFDQVFKGLTGHYVSKKRKLKQNRKK